MAGGKGTRLASIASDIPKPMIPICGKPILEHQIDCLKRNGLCDIVIVVGHLGTHIKEYFGDGSRFGCTISYFSETEPLGTAGALYKIDALINNLAEDFILINGDIIFDIDFNRMIAFHKKQNAWASLAIHPNNHPYDSALIECNDNNQIISWLNKEDERTFHKNLVNAGIHILSPELLKNCPQDKDKVDLDRDILKKMIQSGRIFGYITPEYIKDMGTPERFTEVSRAMEKDIVKNKNLSVKQKCIFLDRDGTINVFNDFVSRPEDFELIDGVAEAIRKINDSGYLAIVITNQPVIARNELDFETLNSIHMKMETELGRQGAFIDDIFFCPHHPDKGFPGERLEYKIDCDCRKPKPGMILEAAEKYNIDLAQSYMVGDHIRDAQAGIAAGCTSILLTESFEHDVNIRQFPNLADFTREFFQE
jgi:D,D-heptose 1,7-bisphosphate phosphatase